MEPVAGGRGPLNGFIFCNDTEWELELGAKIAFSITLKSKKSNIFFPAIKTSSRPNDLKNSYQVDLF